MISPYKEQLDATIWSFSRLKLFLECPAAFKRVYFDHCEKQNNAFAEWGSLGHSILEDYAKGNLMEYELGDTYCERYSEYVHHDFPPTRGTPLSEKYFDSGYCYFASFEGFPSNWEVLGVEQEVLFENDGFNFVGYIDLLVRDKHDGRLIVIDHKSKSAFKSEKEKAEYAIQMYLYSKWVYETYHEFPKELRFNMFRLQKEEVIPFNLEDYEAALNWATDIIVSIYNELDFWDKIYLKYEASEKDISTYKNNDFYCCNLCNCRNVCERSNMGGF